MACNCLPTSNSVCVFNFPVDSATQPTCQPLADGRVVDNPYYDMEGDTSYFTYTFTRSVFGDLLIDGVFIPVCENITSEILSVDEQISICGRFEEVTPVFNSPLAPAPPAGFQYIYIPNGGRYGTGVYLTYRLMIPGDFVLGGTGPLAFRAGGSNSIFSGNYDLLTCLNEPRITVLQRGETIVTGSQFPDIDWSFFIANTGNTPLTNIQFVDEILFDGTIINVESVMASPPEVNIIIGTGSIRLEYTVGSLGVGEGVEITAVAEFSNFIEPNTYPFDSTATVTAMAGSSVVTDEKLLTVFIEAAQVQYDFFCEFDNETRIGRIGYNIQTAGLSPSTRVAIAMLIATSNGCTFVIRSIGGEECLLLDVIEDQLVPINVPITTPFGDLYLLSCVNVLVPEEGQASIAMTYEILEYLPAQIPYFTFRFTDAGAIVSRNDQVPLVSIEPEENRSLVITTEGGCVTPC